MLIFSILGSSFGFTFYFHHCKSTGISNVSLISNEHSLHKTDNLSCCHKNTTIFTNQNNYYKHQLKKDCCSFDEEEYSLSEYDFIVNLNNIILTSDTYIFIKEKIVTSKIVEKLESYYKSYQNKIVKPVKSIISLLSKFAIPQKEDNNSDS